MGEVVAQHPHLPQDGHLLRQTDTLLYESEAENEGLPSARAWASCLSLSLFFWFVYYICLYFAS